MPNPVYNTDLSRLKGPPRPCPCCKNSTLAPPERNYCKFCLTSGFVSDCLSCKSTGKVGGLDAAWGGQGKVESVCNTCGGVGMLPSRAPEAPVKAETTTTTATV